MSDVLLNLKNLLLSLVNNKNYIDLVSIVVVALTSYKVAQYNSSRPNKLKIKQAQFEKVYLPLFRISKNISNTPSIDDAISFSRHIDDILDKNYELVPFSSFKSSSMLQFKTIATFAKFRTVGLTEFHL